MTATILRFPVSNPRWEDARSALAVARYGYGRICEELDARNPANWGIFRDARERLEEAERRMTDA